MIAKFHEIQYLYSDRLFFSTKKKDQDKWVFCTKKNETAETWCFLIPINGIRKKV